MNYRQAAGLLAWELRRRRHVALSLRTAIAIVGLSELRTRSLLDSLTLVLPIQQQQRGWLVAEVAAPWPRPRNPAQRAALLAWTLATEPLTVRQAAQVTGLARNSAYVLLLRMSEVLPIWDDDTLWRADVRRGVIWRCLE